MKFYAIKWELENGGTWTVGLVTMSFETAVRWALENTPPKTFTIRTIEEITTYDSIEMIGVE